MSLVFACSAGLLAFVGLLASAGFTASASFGLGSNEEIKLRLLSRR